MCVAGVTGAVDGSGAASKPINALRVRIDGTRQTLVAWRRRRGRGEPGCDFGDSTDRFELERRERARNRWDSSDGSLLGR